MKKRQKHDYTSELELKSLLIRLKNKKLKLNFSEKYNSKINRYVKLYVKLNKIKYPNASVELKKKSNLKHNLKNTIIRLSEQTNIDYISNERFGEIILLMIKSILTKPNFSGYTYKMDFYSDAIHKILKYMHNFNHKLISERSGVAVNSFAYISQIIHNSVIFIINQKKKEQININKQISNEILDNNLNIMNYNHNNHSDLFVQSCFTKEKVTEHKVGIDDTFEKITKIILQHKDAYKDSEIVNKLTIYYPSTVTFSMKQYDEIKPLLKNVSIVRYK